MSDKKYTIKDWLSGRIGVLVETEKEYDAMMDIAEKEEIRWAQGQRAKKYTPKNGKQNKELYRECGVIRYAEKGGGWGRRSVVKYKDLAPDRPTYAIRITSAGNMTHAVLKVNGKVTKRSMAACHPDDKYDFLTGARAAIDRMQGKKPLSLEDVPTKKLVEELAKRENVSREEFARKDNIIVTAVSKYKANAFDVIGPGTIMIIVDEEDESK